MCSTALPPAPPTPTTLMIVPRVSVSSISNVIVFSCFPGLVAASMRNAQGQKRNCNNALGIAR
jgi:hypothetical protein